MLAYKYPFLAAAKEALKDKALGAVHLQQAQQRVLASLEGQTPQPQPTLDYALEYVGARILLALAGEGYAAKQWAVREAATLAEEVNTESDSTRLAILHELLPSLQRQEGAWSVSVLDYIRHSRDFALAEVADGRVRLDDQASRGLVRSAIESRLLATIPRHALKDIPSDYRAAAEQLRAKLPKYEIQVNSSGKGAGQAYLSRTCIQELRQGVGEGKRWYASMALAIALKHDGVPLEKAREVMSEFVNACPKSQHPFTAREALTTLEWAYKREGPARLSCRNLIAQGLMADYCDACPYRPGRTTKQTKESAL